MAVKTGASGCVVIEGATGIGKSRVTDELMTLTKNLLPDAGLFLGQADAVDQMTDYLAFQSIFLHILGLSLEDPKKNQEVVEKLMYLMTK